MTTLMQLGVHWPDGKSSIDVLAFFAIQHFNSDLYGGGGGGGA